MRKRSGLQAMRAIGAAMALVMAFSVVPRTAVAEEELEAQADLIVVEDAEPSQATSGKCGSVSWSLDSAGTLTIGKAGESGTLADNEGMGVDRWPWSADSIRKKVKSVKVLPGVKTNKNNAYLFANMDKLETIDLSGLDTSGAVTLTAMFLGCGAKTIDCSSFDTSQVMGFAAMFADCPNLKSVDISSFVTNGEVYNGKMLASKSLERVKVGSGFKANLYIGDADDPESASKKWWSQADKKWYTANEIANDRAGIADTYTSYKPAALFPDVPEGHWAAKVVASAVDRGLLSGYSNGKFGAEDNITRGQVAVILWNMAGKPGARSGARSFSDVPSGKYYYQAVRWASSVGVVSGYSGGKFGPEDNVTREQLAVMLSNYASKVGGIATTGSASDFASMSDASSVSGYARGAVGWCFRSKILSGSGGKVMPQGNATRAQAAKMVVFLDDMV